MSKAVFVGIVCFTYWLFSHQIYVWVMGHLAPHLGENGAWFAVFGGVLLLALILDPPRGSLRDWWRGSRQ